MMETEVLVSEDISTELSDVEPRMNEDSYRMTCKLPFCLVHGDSPTPCLVTWGRLTITKTKVFTDETTTDEREEKVSKPGNPARRERPPTKDLFKKEVLQKHKEEESLSSRGEMFQRKRSKVTIEDVSGDEPMKEGSKYFHPEPIIEEAKDDEEQNSPKHPQRKESVVIEELLDDISDKIQDKLEEENASKRCFSQETEREHKDGNLALSEAVEICENVDDLPKFATEFPKSPFWRESTIMEELSDDISEVEDKINANLSDMASPLTSLPEAELGRVSKTVGSVCKEEGPDVKIVEDPSDVEESKGRFFQARKSKNRKEIKDLNEDVTEEIDAFGAFVGSPKGDINHTRRGVDWRNKGGSLAGEEFLEIGGDEADRGGEKTKKEKELSEEVVVRRILKEYGEEEEDHEMLGQICQDQSSTSLLRPALLLLLLLLTLLLSRLLIHSPQPNCRHQDGPPSSDSPPNPTASSPSSCNLDGYVFLSSLP